MFPELFRDIESGKYPEHIPPKPTWKARMKYEIASSGINRIHFIKTSHQVIKAEDSKNPDDDKVIILTYGLAFRIQWMWTGSRWKIHCSPVFDFPCVKPRNAILFTVKG